MSFIIKKIKKFWKALITIISILLSAITIGSFIYQPNIPPLGESTVTIRPNASGDYSQWNVADSNDYGACSDESDSTYIYEDTNDNKDLMNLDACGLGSVTISKIVVWTRAKIYAVSGSYKEYIKSDSTYTAGNEHTTTGTWTDYSTEWTTNPADSQVWEVSDIDSLQAGVIKTGGFAPSVSEVWVVVYYEDALSTPLWGDITINTTAGGAVVEITVNWTDQGTENLHGFYYGWNGTEDGSFVNSSFVDPWSGLPHTAIADSDDCNLNMTLPDKVGYIVFYYCWCNDSIGNWNITSNPDGMHNFTITENSIVFNKLIMAGNPSEIDWGTYTGESGLKYYRNSTWQTEDWIYIKANITGDTPIDTAFLEWKNSSGWYNFTMSQNGTYPDFWAYNTTNQPTYDGYTFNIWANNSMNPMSRIYNWTYYDWQSDWSGTQATWRKHIGLNGTSETFEYEQFYLAFRNYTTEELNYRCLGFEQAVDNGLNDTGVTTRLPTYGHEITCSQFVGWYPHEVLIVDEINITDIYIHVWWMTTNNDTLWIAYDKNRHITVDISNYWEYKWKFNNTYAVAVANLTGQGFYHNYYNLWSYHWVFNQSVENWDTWNDNDINTFCFKINAGVYNYPSVITTQNYASFIIFNLSSNATLNSTDTDNDKLTDWQELFVYFTDPRTADTDAGGERDDREVANGRDPLDPSDDVPTTILAPGWNAIYAWQADVGKTLGQINASLNTDCEGNWTVVAKYNSTGFYDFIYGYSINADVTINDMWDYLFIYCSLTGDEEEDWYHSYP